MTSMGAPKEVAVGIDLGTTFSCITYFDPAAGMVRVFSGASGSRVMPSIVYVQPDGSLVAGFEALTLGLTAPHRLLYDAKRLIGSTFNAEEVAASRWWFDVEEGPGGAPLMKCGPARGPIGDSRAAGAGAPVAAPDAGLSRKYRPEEVSACVLGALKRTAEAALGE